MLTKNEFLKSYQAIANQYVTEEVTETGRYYTINQDKYRSVTTVLKLMSDDEWLETWHRNINDLIYQSVLKDKNVFDTKLVTKTSDLVWLESWYNQIKTTFKESHFYDPNNGKILCDFISEESRVYGTQMHSNIESHFKHEPLPFPNGEGYFLFENIMPLLKPINEVWAQELVIWTNKFKICGRFDCLGLFNGKLTLIDFKSAKNFKQEKYLINYRLQTTLYCYMIYELFGLKIDQVAILIGMRKAFKGKQPQPQIDIFPANRYVVDLSVLIKNYLKGDFVCP